MTTEETVRATFGDAARYLSRDACAAIETQCDRHRVNPETWCRYWRETHPPGFIYPNQVSTENAAGFFEEWVDQQKEYIPILTALELEAFNTEAERARDPVSFLTGRMDDVSPLIRYVMGRYLGYEQEVECWKKQATMQLAELPWYRISLEKMKTYLPEVHSHGPTF